MFIYIRQFVARSRTHTHTSVCAKLWELCSKGAHIQQSLHSKFLHVNRFGYVHEFEIVCAKTTTNMKTKKKTKQKISTQNVESNACWRVKMSIACIFHGYDYLPLLVAVHRILRFSNANLHFSPYTFHKPIHTFTRMNTYTSTQSICL